MDRSRLLVALLLLGQAFIVINAYQGQDDYKYCQRTVKKWAISSAVDLEVKENEHKLHDLLFFLHIPRTGGRTYFHCFLRKLYPTSSECPRSYDKLRFDPGKTNCRLLVTHDDYSMMSKLSRQRTSVITILRNPIDRVFSTYEFSVEVAARFLVHPNLTSATRMAAHLRSKTKGVSTLDIWPWKYLVPWMREDLFNRRDVRKQRSPPYSRGSDPYSMEDIVMPLHEYINDPIARDIIHNGATFQIAGLTNNSYLDDSHEVRHCVLRHPALGKYVLEVAKNRLKSMLYVGLTEDHRESATTFANVVGAQVILQSLASNHSDPADYNKSEDEISFPDSVSNTSHLLKTSADLKPSGILVPQNNETTDENVKLTTVGELMEAYESCISSLRTTQARRRTTSLKMITPANFTKEARRRLPDVLIQEIKTLNSLDMELYEYARNIFSNQQHKKLEQKEEVAVSKEEVEEEKSIFYYPYVGPSWNILWLAVSIVLLLFFALLFVSARRRKRRTLKLKNIKGTAFYGSIPPGRTRDH
ncbi:protein-tyrosine sulfotransferase-like isoform X2 [Impatiens glandulifera]|nr:protein-tyrosine sulfotransferase-like isoform X2 [Impatiens glandulifera]